MCIEYDCGDCPAVITKGQWRTMKRREREAYTAVAEARRTGTPAEARHAERWHAHVQRQTRRVVGYVEARAITRECAQLRAERRELDRAALRRARNTNRSDQPADQENDDVCVDQRDCGHCPQQLSQIIVVPVVAMLIAVAAAAASAAYRWAVDFVREAWAVFVAAMIWLGKAFAVMIAAALAALIVYHAVRWARRHHVVARTVAWTRSRMPRPRQPALRRHILVELEPEGTPAADVIAAQQRLALEAPKPRIDLVTAEERQRAVVRVTDQ